MKYFIYLAAICFVACMDKKPEETGMEGKVMPDFSLQMPDSTTWLDTKELRSGQPVVFFFFRGDCPHCKAQLRRMINNIEDLKELSIYMITGEPFEEMKQFYLENQLEKYPSIKVGRDSTFLLSNYLNVKAVPFLALYNKNKILARTYTGATNPQLIKKILLE